jgi:ABC-type nitrate/sulfonate/bicarbonate transport system permease component
MIKTSKRTNTFQLILPLAGVFLFIGIWEANCHLRLYNLVAPSLQPSAFPSFFEIAQQLFVMASFGSFWEAISTTTRTLSAFGIAVSLGTFLGLVAGRVRLIDALVSIPVEFFRNLPAVAIMPILMLFLGIGTAMKIALCVFGAVFPVFVAARSGIQNIGEEIHLAARFYGWKGWRLIFLVLLPAALPEIAAASQTALAISLILAVMGEMLIGSDGIGSQIVDAERTFNNLDLYLASPKVRWIF